jgi:hypothetical protein
VKHAVQSGILGTNSAFALGPRKTTNLDLVDRSQDLPDANSQLINYHESPLCRLDTDSIENTSSDVLLEGMFIAQLPSNKYPAFSATRMFAETLLSNDDIPPLLHA